LTQLGFTAGDLMLQYRFLWLGVVLTAHAACQDIDTIVFSQDRKPVTSLDQIEDAQERSTFLKLYQQRNIARKKRLAEAFLKRYPSSWLLAQVYEIAAKSAMDLEDYPAALAYGRESLRLLPENPLLLVPLANLQVKDGSFQEGAHNARKALEYLDRYARPAVIPEKTWPALARQLRASSHYALGRAALTEGLSVNETREMRLDEAVKNLSRARVLNPDDPEIAYLLGLAYLALGNRLSAATEFATLTESAGVWQKKAREQLGKLGEVDLRKLPARLPAAKQESAGRTSQWHYAGSQACRSCHSSQHAAWKMTGMARMLRPYRPENIMGDFSGKKKLDERSVHQPARMWMDKDLAYFATRRADGSWEQYAVDYTIGSKWQQAYATRLPTGQIHVFPLQYNKLQGKWFNYWRIIDPPGSARADLDRFHRHSSPTNYQVNCAPCHTSQLRTEKPGSREPEDLVFREAGVNCEMCHGPSGQHVAAMSAGKPYAKSASQPPVDFPRLDHRQYVAVCAQCHMQSAIHEPGPRGEWNYSESGESFIARYLSRPLTEFSHRISYKDGRLRETTFIAEAFLRTACYDRGQAHCGHCHDPHPADAAANPSSLKYADRPDLMCLQCHTRLAGKVQAHTRHAEASEASRCVTCHMPRIMNSVLFLARTHQIDDIPRAENTLRFGPTESPNACLICHQNRDEKWLKQQLQAWR
jgi:predicted CXXCH cytochrome family protein